MVRYLDLLKVKTYNTRKEIEELNEKLKKIELETAKEYFSIGSKVIYNDFFETIEGIVVDVNDRLEVVVRIIEIDGDYCEGLRTFDARELNKRK